MCPWVFVFQDLAHMSYPTYLVNLYAWIKRITLDHETWHKYRSDSDSVEVVSCHFHLPPWGFWRMLLEASSRSCAEDQVPPSLRNNLSSSRRRNFLCRNNSQYPIPPRRSPITKVLSIPRFNSHKPLFRLPINLTTMYVCSQVLPISS
jgi:hypothetical protein